MTATAIDDDLETRKRLGRNLRAAMDAKGLTVVKLAADLGMSRPHLNNLVNGHHAMTLTTAKILADAIGIHLDSLFDLSPNK